MKLITNLRGKTRVYERKSDHVIVSGPAFSGKTSISNSIELALFGRLRDFAGRDASKEFKDVRLLKSLCPSDEHLNVILHALQSEYQWKLNGRSGEHTITGPNPLVYDVIGEGLKLFGARDPLLYWARFIQDEALNELLKLESKLRKVKKQVNAYKDATEVGTLTNYHQVAYEAGKEQWRDLSSQVLASKEDLKTRVRRKLIDLNDQLKSKSICGIQCSIDDQTGAVAIRGPHITARGVDQSIAPSGTEALIITLLIGSICSSTLAPIRAALLPDRSIDTETLEQIHIFMCQEFDLSCIQSSTTWIDSEHSIILKR